MPDLRLRLDIAYDGTAFSGWAVQPGRRTVAGVLGEALQTVTRGPVPMVVAGRTDAGVHAVGQVAHIDVPATVLPALVPRDRRAGEGEDRDAGSSGSGRAAGDAAWVAEGAVVGLRRRLAGILPPDVRVWAASVAPTGFDARFSALRRHYRYRILCSEWGLPPLRRADTLHHRRMLDVETMRRAAVPLIGLHDFAAYCKPREGATTIRDLQRLDVGARPLEEGEGLMVEIRVVADAFCHSMVRSLVGALMAVGDGRSESGRPAALLAGRRRTAEIAVAPAHGLTLMRVDYPPDADLAERAVLTRAVRSATAGCDCED